MISRLKKVGEAPFLRAVAVLSSGQMLAMILPILAAPLLGRLYLPSDYGVLAQYMAPAAVLAVLASLQFQHAVIAERTDRAAGQAAWLTMLAALAGAGLTTIAIAALWRPVLSGTAVGIWFAFLPLSVAGGGLSAAAGFLANRYRRYTWIAKLQVIQVSTTVALSITFGLLKWGPDGLLAAYFFGQALQLGAFFWFLSGANSGLARWPGWSRLRAIARRHWRFPAFTLPSEFSGQLNLQAPVFALGALGAEATLGAFTRAHQLVSMPLTLLGNSVAQVFRREASEQYNKTGNCRPLMLRTAGSFLVLGVGPCILFMLFAPWLFVTYLGPAWEEAGEISRILAPMLLLRVIVSPVTTVFYFTNNQALDLKLTIFSAIIMLASISFAWVAKGTPFAFIWAFAGAYVVVYSTYGFFSLIIAQRTSPITTNNT